MLSVKYSYDLAKYNYTTITIQYSYNLGQAILIKKAVYELFNHFLLHTAGKIAEEAVLRSAFLCLS